MSSRLTLTVKDGPLKGKVFVFSEHDTFLFGRMGACHCCLPEHQENGLVGQMRGMGQMDIVLRPGEVDR